MKKILLSLALATVLSVESFGFGTPSAAPAPATPTATAAHSAASVDIFDKSWDKLSKEKISPADLANNLVAHSENIVKLQNKIAPLQAQLTEQQAGLALMKKIDLSRKIIALRDTLESAIKAKKLSKADAITMRNNINSSVNNNIATGKDPAAIVDFEIAQLSKK